MAAESPRTGVETRDPELKVLRALYPSGSGDAIGILIDSGLYSKLWAEHEEFMRGHNVSGRAGGCNTFVSGLDLENFMEKFGFWIEDGDANPIDMTGLKG